MMRVVLLNILLLTLPTIVYFTYVYWYRLNEPDKEIGVNAPVFWLLSLGVILMLIGLFFLGRWEDGDTQGRYVPPRFEDGVIVPGRVEPGS